MDPVLVRGDSLTLDALVRVARGGAPVTLPRDDETLRRLRASCDFVDRAVREGRPLYGVTTSFGGMSQIDVPGEQAALLQRSAVWAHKAGVGEILPHDCTRAAMVVRMGSHLRGVSGVRPELIERLAAFLNAGATPLVPELGSIGASGDLVPLAYIAGAVIGLDRCFLVELDGARVPAPEVLARLDLAPIALGPKEALAMMNGTSFSTAIAALCARDAAGILSAALGFHALALQALRGSARSFAPFIHDHKPHPGQRWVAAELRALLEGSGLAREEADGGYADRRGDLIQDRYSLRCLPQFLGPLVDGLAQLRRQIEVEMSSATDNPLIDAEAGASYHGGNFLAQYIGLGMDQLRHHLGLSGKHVDAQIALLMTPEFSGLPPSLVGNAARRSNIGLKALQLAGNAIMPLLCFYGAPLVDRFPTHAEQFNQNINSQSFGAANLARRSVTLARQHLAIALLVAVQAVDLRAARVAGHHDARALLSPPTRALYEAVREVVGRPPEPDRPYVWNDDEQALDAHIEAVVRHLSDGGRIAEALAPLCRSLEAFS